MFKDSEIKAALVEETQGTNENQPLKFLWSPVIEPKRKNGDYDFTKVTE